MNDTDDVILLAMILCDRLREAVVEKKWVSGHPQRTFEKLQKLSLSRLRLFRKLLQKSQRSSEWLIKNIGCQGI